MIMTHQSASKHKEGGGGGDGSQNVLIAVDDSVHSDHAITWYLDNLHRDENHIILLHVADPHVQPVYTVQGMAVPREEWEKMVSEFKEKVNETRKKYIDKLHKANITKVRFVHKNGSPGPSIVQAAVDEHCQLIVVGTRGLGTVRRTILGSVSDYILHHSHVPVAICRGV
jgi:nucleotide-binding universal stress UspA family protein